VRSAAPLLALAAAVALVARSGANISGHRILVVGSASMEPTLRCAGGPGCSRLYADRVVIQPTWHAAVERQSIVVIKRTHAASTCGSGKLLLKRVIGLPEDTVAQRDGVIYVDGRRLAEPYVPIHLGGRDFAGIHIPRNAYFVMGDNRNRSCDSRDFGPVYRPSIIGAVVAISHGRN